MAKQRTNANPFAMPEGAATLTRAEAISASGRDIYCKRFVDSTGQPSRLRRNGACQTWKTRPEDFSLPVKYGMSDAFRITHQTADDYFFYLPKMQLS